MASRTALHAWHVGAGAKMIAFGGWEMPLQYAGIVEEHHAVRSAAGLFDVSHMGKLVVEGAGARASLQHLCTNGVPGTVGRARYTHVLGEDGAILDDVIVTCLGPERFLVVCNAGPRERIAPWVRGHLRGAALRDETAATACLALQGPRSTEILTRLAGGSLPAMRPFDAAWVDLLPPRADRARGPPEAKGRGASGAPRSVPGAFGAEPPVDLEDSVLVMKTGYTGEEGYELLPPSGRAIDVWTSALDAGRSAGLVPVGLGARDTLRLEKGFLLSGQDFTGRETSLEASCEWLVKWDHDFVGRGALERQRAGGRYRRLLGLRMLDRGIPRPGCVVRRGGADVGLATSGTFSPSLKVGIALAYLEPSAAAPGTRVEVAIRGALHPAEVVKPPFL